MSAREFFKLVAEMRSAQKNYFRTRSKEDLVKSKTLESEVDREIARVSTIMKSREI